MEGNFFIKDTNGAYQFVNSHFCKTFRVDRNEVIGKDDYFVFSPELAEQLIANDKRIMESKTSEVLEESGMVKEKLSTYRNNKVPLIDENGEVCGIFGVAFDITYQKSLEQEREELITKLQSALDEIKTLKGIIPICSYCKKIEMIKGHGRESKRIFVLILKLNLVMVYVLIAIKVSKMVIWSNLKIAEPNATPVLKRLVCFS